MKPASNVRFVKTATGGFLTNYQTGKCLSLNQTALIIWSGISAGLSDDDLRSELKNRFPNVPESLIRKDIDQFTSQLRQHRLVEDDALQT